MISVGSVSLDTGRYYVDGTDQSAARKVAVLVRILGNVKYPLVADFSMHYTDTNHNSGWYYKGNIDTLAWALKVYRRWDSLKRYKERSKGLEK